MLFYVAGKIGKDCVFVIEIKEFFHGVRPKKFSPIELDAKYHRGISNGSKFYKPNKLLRKNFSIGEKHLASRAHMFLLD